METVTRKPFQGVLNIIRFNWHFYVIATVVVLGLANAAFFLGQTISWICILIAAGITISTFISLSVSYYVYDLSGLYDFSWLKDINLEKIGSIANVHAGFDESSVVLRKHFPVADLKVYDFYDSEKHTEVSIERARKAYPPFTGTEKVTTDHLPVGKASTDVIFNIFALHEIREASERVNFMKVQAAALKNEGRCIVVEHLRDVPNFLAYNIGFFHFFAEREWRANFSEAGFSISKKFKITPFITVFILNKAHGNTP
jgi:hypothetical protein